MERISTFTTPKIKTNFRSERDEQLTLFYEKINADREGFKPVSYPRLAKLLEHLPTNEMYTFYRNCERANHFQKYFWYKLKNK